MLTELLFNIISGMLVTIDTAMPKFNLSPEFINNFSVGTDIVIDFIAKAGYFIPLDSLVNCLTAVIVVRNYKSILGIFKWVMNLTKGGSV